MTDIRKKISAADAVSDAYRYGFVTDIDAETAPKGLNEDIIRFISAKKGEPDWLLAFRLKAYRHWLTMTEPSWAMLSYPPIDYQDIYYYAAPKSASAPKSLDEVDPELLKTYDKLGVPLQERALLAGRRRFRQRFRRDDFSGTSGKAGHRLLLDFRSR